MYILGEPDELGGWDPSCARRMNWNPGNVWDIVLTFRASTVEQPFHFKILIVGENYAEFSKTEQQKLWDNDATLKQAKWGEDWEAYDNVRELNVGLHSDNNGPSLREALEAASAQEGRVHDLEKAIREYQKRCEMLEGEVKQLSILRKSKDHEQERLREVLKTIRSLLDNRKVRGVTDNVQSDAMVTIQAAMKELKDLRKQDGDL